MKCTLKIELFSDLCAGSGKAFGQIIDSDICYDDCGLPFIPARRLKGCLRDEAKRLAYAKVITLEDIDSIFGVAGSRNSGSLQIDDAYLADCNSIRNEIKKQQLDKFSVLSLFTSVRGQTSLNENGSANENSLRYTRVVNRYNPLEHEKKNNVLLASVEVDSQYFDKIKVICKALRHIGMHRTRGLGAVECSLAESGSDDINFAETLLKEYDAIKDCEEKLCISYYIRLDNPLTLPKPGGGILDSIEARSVIGCFAGRYLQAQGVSADDTAFENLFLNGNVIWSSLYISDGQKLFSPAPMNLVKLKYTRSDGRKYVNCLAVNVDDMSQPKSLEGKYAAESESGYVFTQPVCGTAYHHSTGRDATLYTQDSVVRGQVFGGTVTFGKDEAKKVIALFKDSSICFGRSRSAQYASCRVIKADLSALAETEYKVKAGEAIYAVLKSDLLVLSGSQGQCLMPTEIKAKISAALEKNLAIPEKGAYDNCCYKTVSGFNTLWGLHKEPVRVVGAGSIYEFTAVCDCTLPSYVYVGENLQEGFGFIEIIPASKMKNLIDITPLNNAITEAVNNDSLQKSRLTHAVSEAVIKNKCENAAHEFFDINDNYICSLSSSFVGRVALMLKESTNSSNFADRIESIKDKKKKSTFKTIYNKLKMRIDELYYEVFNEKPTDETCFIYYKAATLTVLTLAKYKLRTEKSTTSGGDNHD